MNYEELLQAARGQMGPCHACPVCNGRACGGNIPGPGAKGSDAAAAVDAAFDELKSDGTMQKLADKYSLSLAD